MLSKGFSATSVDEICKGARLTKGSLFHYFSTKEELGSAVLDRYLSQVFEKLEAIRGRERDPLARVYAWLEFLSEAAEVYPLRHGCILGRFTQELSETHPRIRAQCARHFERWIDSIASELEQAGKQHGIRNVKARSLAEYTVAAFEGALILARANRDCAVVRRTVAHVRQHLERIFEIPAAGRRRNTPN
jgi:TetR/AcrR family transcriptional regulator, transcriptional repressor for nem operon